MYTQTDPLKARVANAMHEALANSFIPIRDHIMEVPGALDAELYVDSATQARIKVQTKYGPRHFLIKLTEKM